MNSQRQNYLKTYTVTLEAEGPVFVGSGKEYAKNEYMFLNGFRNIGIMDMQKLYEYMFQKRMKRQFEDYLMNDNRTDLRRWLRDNRLSEADVAEKCVKYKVPSGDTSLERGTRTQVMEFIKDPFGHPYIPGSSLKGMLRTLLLGEQILSDSDLFAGEKRQMSEACRQYQRRNIYLLREIRNIETTAFHTLTRTEKPQDMVNDSLAGLIVSDSDPLSVEDLVLCQKIERHTDGTEKRLNLLRESLRPGTKMVFSMTIDRSICHIDEELFLKAVETFAQVYNRCFLKRFSGMDEIMPDEVFLGGGAGFLSKTVIYPMYGHDDGLDMTQTIFRQTKVPEKHKHSRDRGYGVSPHIVKCTHYKGATLQMGLCKFSIKESQK